MPPHSSFTWHPIGIIVRRGSSGRGAMCYVAATADGVLRVTVCAVDAPGEHVTLVSTQDVGCI